MKIGLVLPATPAYSETFLINKIKGLEQHGFEVFLFVNSKSNNSNDNVIAAPNLKGHKALVFFKSIVVLCKALCFSFGASKKMYQLNRNEGFSFGKNVKNMIINQHILSKKVDWLHFEFGTMALGRECVAQAIQAKMGVSFRGFDIAIYPVKHKNCYDLLWKKVDKIHVISEDIRALVIKNGCKEATKIVKIYPAIDTAFFANEEYKRTTSESIQLLTVARLNWKKGVEYTLEAMAILKKRGINFHYTIIGEGQEYERLKFATYQLQLTENVTFLGKLASSEVKKCLIQSDIYIQYSIQEGFCNAVLEAQAMQKICIVSDAEGLPENVVDAITGFVVPKRNPLALAQKIEEVVALSEAEKETIASNAKERVTDLFDLTKQLQKIIAFYVGN